MKNQGEHVFTLQEAPGLRERRLGQLQGELRPAEAEGRAEAGAGAVAAAGPG